MSESEFYDGTKLLSMVDLDGMKPEILMCTSNRSGGKTTFFNRYVVNRWKRGKGKFILLYRWDYELDEVADTFYKEIGNLFFPNTFMTSKRHKKGLYHELFINEKSCGYAVALNKADALKKVSHLFVDATVILFDEFQSETNHYCPEEMRKFKSLHDSFARGGGKQVRFLPVIMLSNPVSIINPYYVDLGISSRLTNDVKFLRGHGFVLEQGFNKSASLFHEASSFHRAFAGDDYTAYSSQGVYLNDNQAFIEKPEGTDGKYVATIKYKDKSFAIREYPSQGIIYCDDKYDRDYPFKISVTTDDHNVNYVMLKNNDMFLLNLRFYFNHGCCRFKDLQCKEALMTAISY